MHKKLNKITRFFGYYALKQIYQIKKKQTHNENIKIKKRSLR